MKKENGKKEMKKKIKMLPSRENGVTALICDPALSHRSERNFRVKFRQPVYRPVGTREVEEEPHVGRSIWSESTRPRGELSERLHTGGAPRTEPKETG